MPSRRTNGMNHLPRIVRTVREPSVPVTDADTPPKFLTGVST